MFIKFFSYGAVEPAELFHEKRLCLRCPVIPGAFNRNTREETVFFAFYRLVHRYAKNSLFLLIIFIFLSGAFQMVELAYQAFQIVGDFLAVRG